MEAIREARPPRFYVACDGPRADRPGESEMVARVREEILRAVDWPCEVHTLFRDANLGCKAAVADAIDWFFRQEPEGVILEDDCLPSHSFFGYCDELLATYRDDPAVMAITGNRFFDGGWKGLGSYTFGRHPFIWGWASWARAWQGYDRDLSLPDDLLEDVAQRASGSHATRNFWLESFRKVREGSFNTWDVSWFFHVVRHQGKCIYPRRNLVTNIGFGEAATHATGRFSILANLPLHEMSLPLDHRMDPADGQRLDKLHDRYIYVRRFLPLRMLNKVWAWLVYRTAFGTFILLRKDASMLRPMVELIPATPRSRRDPDSAGSSPRPEGRRSSAVSAAEAEGSSPR
jgi:hypothetical protein